MLKSVSRASLAEAGPDIAQALEAGSIVFFSECPIRLPAADDLDFMRRRMPAMLKHKNISYHSQADKIYGIEGSKEDIARTRQILAEHQDQVERFLNRHIPQLINGAQLATASFRPLQEQGRKLSPHANNELVHVDAGAYGATHGDRILRFFINVNEQGEDRVWASKGKFRLVYRRYGEQAGIARPKIHEGIWDKTRTGLATLLGKLNPVLKTALDSSPYDRAMRKLHNYMKDTPECIEDKTGYEEFRFPPGSAWMCFTDGVSHACLSGQHCFADTYIIPLDNCGLPEEAPYNILQKGL